MTAAFGGLVPFPIPLGGDALEGLRAEQHARAAADLVALWRSEPFAIVNVDFSAEPPIPVVRCRAPESPENEFVPGGTPQWGTLILPNAPVDEFGNAFPVKIVGCDFFPHNSASEDQSIEFTHNVISIREGDGGGGGNPVPAGTLVIYAEWGKKRTIEHYGGDPDKMNTRTETTPYSWVHYRELSAAWGSAYSGPMVGAIHARKLAYSRALSAVDRAEDRRRANSTPHTADIKLLDWAASLRVPVSLDAPRWKIRRICAAFHAAKPGQSIPDLEEAIVGLIGDRLIQVRVFGVETEHGTWPPSWDLGGGVWASDRARILVDVRGPADQVDQEFRELIQVRLMQLLDRIVPATCVFDWTVVNEDGFLLDISRLGIDGF